MAPGIAHRCTQPAFKKVNAYPKCLSDASRWESKQPKIPKGPVEKKPSKTSLHRKRPQQEIQPSGRDGLSNLPLEIIFEVLPELDLSSLSNVRLLSSYFKEVLESLPAYRLLNQHASHTLKVIHKTGASSAITLKRLFGEFNQPSCRGCGAFGPFVFIPTVHRCCEKCLQSKYNFQVVPLRVVSSYFAVPLRMVRENVPIIQAPAGNYGHPWNFYVAFDSADVVSVRQVEDLAIQIHGSKKRMQETVQANWDESVSRYQEEMRRWSGSQDASSSNPPTRKPYRPRCLSLHPDLHSWLLSRWRCRGATDLPFWDAQKQISESGVYCSACGYHKNPERPINANLIVDSYQPAEGNNVAFTIKTIPQHFERCTFVKRGYKFGARYFEWNLNALGLDFYINEEGEEIEQDLRSRRKIPKRYVNPWAGIDLR